MLLFLYNVKMSQIMLHLDLQGITVYSNLATCLGTDLLCIVRTRLFLGPLGPPLSCGGTNGGSVNKKIVKAAAPEMWSFPKSTFMFPQYLDLCVCI